MRAKVELVKQRGAYDCAVATLAMLTNLEYDSVKLHFDDDLLNSRYGLTHVDVDFFLHELGYAVRTVWGHKESAEAGRTWPVTPFAPIHYAFVETLMGMHAVVMLNNGTVLDPNGFVTTLNTYKKVHVVVGVYKVE